MPDFSSTAAVTLSADQWIAESKKATKATKKLTEQTRRLADISEKGEKRLRKEAKQAKALAVEENRLAAAKKRSAVAYAAVAAAAVVAFRVIKASVELAREQERVELQVAAAIKSTGGAAGLTLAALKEMATEQQRLTGIGDEVTLRYQSVLLTFTKIGRDVFPMATRAVANMSARLGQDLTSAAILVGKALNDPILGVTALSRSGIQFTVSQKAVIKSLVETNRMAEAQALILKELEIQFGGSAEAAAKDSAILAAAVGDLGEEIGSNLDPTIQAVSRSMLKWVEAIIAVMQELGGLTGVLATVRSAVAESMAIIADSIASVIETGRDLPAGWLPGMPSDEELNKTAQGFRDLADGLEAVAAEQIGIAIDASNRALGRTEEAALDASRAVGELALSEKELNEQLKEQARQARIVADALRGVREAQRSLIDLSGLQLMPVGSVGSAGRREALLEDQAELLDLARQRADVLREIESTGERMFRVQTQSIALAKKLNLTQEQAAKLIAKRIKEAADNQELVVTAAEKWFSVLVGIGGALQGVDSQLGDIVSGLGQAAGAFQLARDNGAGMAQSIGAAAQASGLLNEQLLGSTGSSIAQGAAQGAQMGGWWGALIGGVIGWAMDAFQTTERTFADAATDGQGLLLDTRAAASDLGGVTNDFMRALSDMANNILHTIGGTFAEFTTIGVQFQENEEGVRVWINGIMRTFGDNMQAALDFALTEVFKRTDIIGLSPTVAGAIENFAGGTVEELQRDIADALAITSLGLTNFEIGLANRAKELGRLLDRAVEDFGAGAEAVLLGPGGFVGTFQTAYDQAFNIQADQEALTEQRIASLQAQMAIARAQLLVMKLQLEGQAAEVAGRQSLLRAEGIMTAEVLEIRAAELRGTAAMAEGRSRIFEAQLDIERAAAGGLGAFSGAIAATGIVAAESAAAIAGALAAVDEALAFLDTLDFSTGAINAALARGRRAGRGISGGVTEQDPTEDLRRQLELLRIGEDAAALSAFLYAETLAETQAALDNSTLSEEERAELLALMQAEFDAQQQARIDEQLERERQLAEDQIRLAQETRDAILDPWRDALADTSFAGRLEDLREAARAAADEIDSTDGLASNLADLALIEESAAAQAEALGLELQDAFRSTITGVIGLLQRNLEFIDDPAERERIQAMIIRFEQDKLRFEVESFRLAVMKHEMDLLAFGLLDEEAAAWIAGMLDGLDIIEGNFEGIFEGMADSIIGAGQQFAQSVHDAAGSLGGVIPLLVTNMEAFMDLIFSPPRTVADVESVEGLQLAQLLARIEALANPVGALSPAEQLMQMAQDLEPFFEAFGLSFEEITAQIQDLVDSEVLTEVQSQFEQFQAQFFGGGQFSGRTDAARLPFLHAELMSALQRGDDAEAARLAQEGFQLSQGVSAAWAARFADIIRSVPTSVPGSGIPLDTAAVGGGTAGDREPFTASMNAFELQTRNRHMVTERNRFDLNEQVTLRLDALIAQNAEPARAADPPRPTLTRRVPPATGFSSAGPQ